MGAGAVQNATAFPPSAPSGEVATPAPGYVSIVILSEDTEENFTWLYESIENEINTSTDFKADAGNDLIFDTKTNLTKCLDAADILKIDEGALHCVSQTRGAAVASFEVIVRIKITSNPHTYHASFAVIKNTPVAVEGTLEAEGTKNDILKASWSIIQKAFAPEPQTEEEEPPPPEVDLALSSPPPPSAEENTFTRVDERIETTTSSNRILRWKWPIIFGALGITTTSTAVVLGAYAKSLESDSQKAMHRDDAFDKYDDAKRIALASNILFGASIILAGGVAYTWFGNAKDN